jgi:hypothetical protein
MTGSKKEKADKKVTINGGIGFTLLTIVFIVLKLIGKIDWTWGWVLAPLWLPYAIVIFVILVGLILRIISESRK